MKPLGKSLEANWFNSSIGVCGTAVVAAVERKACTIWHVVWRLYRPRTEFGSFFRKDKLFRGKVSDFVRAPMLANLESFALL